MNQATKLAERILQLTKPMPKPAAAFDFIHHEEFAEIDWKNTYRQVGGAICGNIGEAFEVLQAMCPSYRVMITGPHDGPILGRWKLGVEKTYVDGSGIIFVKAEASDLALAIVAAALKFS